MKIDSETRLRMNRRLAKLLGWQDIRRYGSYGHLIGVRPHTTGDQLIPNWTDDWHACGKLLTDLEIGLDFDHLGSVVAEFFGKPICFVDHPTSEMAVRCALVVGAIKKLEREQGALDRPSKDRHE